MPLLAFTVAIAFWPGLLSSAVAPRWALMAVGLPLCSRLDPREIDPRAQILIGALLTYAAASLLWSTGPLDGWNDLFRLLIFLGAILAGSNQEDLSPVMRAMAWGVAVSALLVPFQLAGHSPVDEASIPAGLFYNRDFLAEAAAVFFVWAVFSREVWLAALLAIPLAVSGSRVALLCAAAGILSAGSRKTMIGAACLVAVAVGVMFVFPNKIGSAETRLVLWQGGIGGIVPFGQGLGSFMAAHPTWEYAHSDLIQSFYELGIGAIPLLAFLIFATISPASAAIRGAMVCVFGEYLIAFPLHLPATTLVAGLLAGNLVRGRTAARAFGYVGRGGLVANA